ncbi:MAG TPA: DNA repair protein RadA [Candidatus Latescibacteria bacterium]|nr:DNA repair protein RadA [Candidatus Latescibacterota bacterium]
MAKEKTVYVCQACGARSPRWFGRCPECGEWNTCVEEVVRKEKPGRVGDLPVSEVVPITQIPPSQVPRRATGIGELDRALGGGIVPGSAVLVAGDPGIGKSTLLLQASGSLAFSGEPVLYVSGEESAQQVRLRAERIGALSEELWLLAETNVEAVLAQMEKISPTLAVVDSVQTLFAPELDGAPGGVSQVRECAARLVGFAKRTGTAVFLIGHVTKEGTIAGPRLLEHMVDTVLALEGDRHHAYRVLRAVKNRFGSTNEVGLFEMRERGMAEVLNPSEIFLPERAEVPPGSAVACTMEGTRPILVEIQALVAPTAFGYPQRSTTGIDGRRLAMLLAVLEKRIGLRLGDQDVFCNAAGGVRIEEPAADLAVALAVASSFRDRPIPSRTVAIGEVGLGGEVRPVGHIAQRLSEAQKLGFERCLLAKGNLKGLSRTGGMWVIGVERLDAAIVEAMRS